MCSARFAVKGTLTEMVYPEADPPLPAFSRNPLPNITHHRSALPPPLSYFLGGTSQNMFHVQVCHMINHADVMQQMSTVDRETTNLILANCLHNLQFPEFQEHVLQEGLRQAGGGRGRQPYGFPGGGYGGQPPPGRGCHQ